MTWSLFWFVVMLTTVAAQELEPFTIQDFISGDFSQRGFAGTWISDFEFTYTRPNEPGIYMFNARTLNSSVLVEGSLMNFLNTTSPILSADREYILAPIERTPVYRYSATARYSLYEISSGNVTEIGNGERLQLCIFGGGHSLAYVYENNLYYLPENAATPIQITDNGIVDELYNGHTDWVYEEDVMYSGQATWFSTGGSYLAFASFDDRLVKTYSYYYYVDKTEPEDLYPELVHLKYPKVGDVNPLVTLRVLNLTNLAGPADIQLIPIQPPDIVGEDHILGGVRWITDTEFAAHWLNRRQNHTVLRIYNIETGLYEEEEREQENGWVPIALPSFNNNGSFYMSLRWSPDEIGGVTWQHLYMSIRDNGTIVSRPITPQPVTVDNFLGMNEDNTIFYYTATLPNTPWRRHVYSVGPMEACLSCDIVLPQDGNCTWASATLSLGGSYMTITCSSSMEPSATYIVDLLNVTNLYLWEHNMIVRERLENKIIPRSIITTVPLENGFNAPVRIHLPPELDLNDTETKYPAIFFVYSGPNTNTVFDSFTVGYHSYLTTNKSMIYMMADGRGSGLNGRDILYSLNNALGSVEIEDHLVILRQLLGRYPWIDSTRVGMWGHSYGGYATLLTLVIDDDNMIRCGVSGAPVTSWIYYNTMYTERYMGLPTAEDNLSGYEHGDVTLLVQKLKNKDFYIMHGNADDNVHYQNAAKLMRALQEANIPFEQMSYPDEAHSLAPVNMHRYMTMDRYWARCLDLPNNT